VFFLYSRTGIPIIFLTQPVTNVRISFFSLNYVNRIKLQFYDWREIGKQKKSTCSNIERFLGNSFDRAVHFLPGISRDSLGSRAIDRLADVITKKLTRNLMVLKRWYSEGGRTKLAAASRRTSIWGRPSRAEPRRRPPPAFTVGRVSSDFFCVCIPRPPARNATNQCVPVSQQLQRVRKWPGRWQQKSQNVAC